MPGRIWPATPGFSPKSLIRNHSPPPGEAGRAGWVVVVAEGKSVDLDHEAELEKAVVVFM